MMEENQSRIVPKDLSIASEVMVILRAVSHSFRGLPFTGAEQDIGLPLRRFRRASMNVNSIAPPGNCF